MTRTEKIIEALKFYADIKNWEKTDGEKMLGVGPLLAQQALSYSEDKKNLIKKQEIDLVKTNEIFTNDLFQELNRIYLRYGTFNVRNKINQFNVQYKAMLARFLDPIKTKGIIYGFNIIVNSEYKPFIPSDENSTDYITSKINVSIFENANSFYNIEFTLDSRKDKWEIKSGNNS